MISIVLTLIKKSSKPERLLYKHLETEQATILFSKVEENFFDFLVEKNRENRPYLYLKLVDLLGKDENSMAEFMPNACFKIEAEERIIDFINNFEKP